MWSAGWTHTGMPMLGRWPIPQVACWDPPSSEADTGGYAQLVAAMASWGRILGVGVEGTGSYGAGLARHLGEARIGVVEVNRPNRQLRRRRGKDDHTDAEAAARAAFGGEATAVPKSGDGPVEWIRMLTVTRRSAVKARTQAANQIHSLMVCAPEPLKAQLRDLNLKAQVRVCARLRPSGESSVSYAKQALRRLARRYQTLDAEIRELDVEIKRLCATANPALLAAHGVGPDSAAALLIAAGDNPARMKSERSFAALCGASPVQASSGRTVRHRLNRGGNRQANSALWPMRYHPDTYRRCHQRICCQTPSRRKEPPRDHPMPQTAHRPTNLPPPHQPATNPELRATPQPTPTSPHHHHRNRPRSRNPPQPHLRTRTRPRPQPPPRYPIPELAPQPTTGPTNIDLTNTHTGRGPGPGTGLTH